ncbi:MAG: SDR family oxidoreductase [Candidatus Omnitrophica bacterium]|nr:SDR family oxidoreductase [Candidatus Omnitrophota bacterium]
MRLAGKVALVTGGAKRIGREIALSLASRGVHVAITYRTSRREALRTVREIEEKGVRGICLRVDQRVGPQVHRAVSHVHALFRRLDILVNNASSFYPTPLEGTTEAQWEDLLSTNLGGPWRFSKAAAPFMKRQGSGKILNIADSSAFSPWADYLPYCAAKGGLITLTRGLAKALAPKIQVNAVAPGPILFPPGIRPAERARAIEKTLLKRMGSPQDVAAAVLFFLEGSDFVTGAVLPVEGGRLLA